MKRSTKKQANKLVVSVDKIRGLTKDQIQGAVGGLVPRPCAHSNGGTLGTL